MAAKIVLGKRPESFKATVTVDMLDGTKGVIEVDYAYRTKTEYGDLVDKLSAEAIASAKESDAAAVKATEAADAVAEEPTVNFRFGDLQKATRAQAANFIMHIVKGWNLDAEFGEASVLQLCDELPGAATALMERYRAACVEGRAKN